MPDAIDIADPDAAIDSGRAAWCPLFRTAGMLAVPLLLWWWALLPGGMSTDSFTSWDQVVGGPWSNHHPAPYTAWMWLTSFGGLTPDTVSLADVLLVAMCLAALACALRRVFHVGHAVTAAALLLVVLPLLGPFATILWKDIPETALLLLAAALVLTLPRGGASRRRLVAVGGVALVIALLRWNGGVTDVVIGASLLVTRARRPRLPVAAVFVAAGLGGFLVLRAIPAVFPVAPVNAVESSAQQLTELAQYADRSPSVFRPDERKVLERVAPFPEWAYAGTLGCTSVNPTIFGLIHNRGRDAVAEANIADLKSVWLHVSLRHPFQLLRAHMCRAALVWRLFLGRSPPRVLTVYPTVDGNADGLHQQAPGWLRHAAVSYAQESNSRWLQNLAWLPASWLLAVLALGVITHVRDGQWRLLQLVVSVPVAELLSFMIFPAAEDARYTYAAVVVLQLGAVAYVGRIVATLSAAGKRWLPHLDSNQKPFD